MAAQRRCLRVLFFFVNDAFGPECELNVRDTVCRCVGTIALVSSAVRMAFL